MASAAQLRTANQGISTLANRELGSLWRALDLTRPERARDMLVEYVPAITDTFGDMSATVAADWYEEAREAAVAGRYNAQLAPTVERERVAARVRFGAQHLFTENPTQTLVFLAGAVDKYVLQPGRDTIVLNANRDPDAYGWHRETRADACKFCRMLAGRGGVYRRSTAAFGAHERCNCVAVASWDANAEEVDAQQYEASQRMEDLRVRAAAGSEHAQRALDDYRRRVREFVAAMPD